MSQAGYRFEDTSWQPPEGVVSHNGEPINPEEDFFCPPPPEIGKVITAHSDLKRTKNPFSTEKRLILAIPVCATLAGGCFMLMRWASQGAREMTIPVLVVACIASVGLLVGGIAAAIVSFDNYCSYVGANGLATIRLRGSRQGLMKTTVFTFDQAETLSVYQRRDYQRGIYNGTEYAFRWRGDDNGIVHPIKGRHYSQKGTPHRKTWFYFGQAADLAWTAFLTERRDKELSETGGIDFVIGVDRVLRIEPNALVIRDHEETQRIEADALRGCDISDGVLVINCEARRYDHAERYIFSSSKIANATLLLHYLMAMSGRECSGEA